LGNHAAATEDLKPLAALTGYESVNLWLWEIETLVGNRSKADAFLDAADTTSTDPLVRGVVAMLRGERTAADLLTAAEADGNDMAKLYAYYYGGSQAFAQGSRTEAEASFRKALELGRIGELEHELAACHLAAL